MILCYELTHFIKVLFLWVSWEKASDSPTVTLAAKRFIEAVSKAAREVNSLHSYLHLNYAASWQEPIKSYGADTVAKMVRVSEKYDPNAVFQNLCVGGFKLGRNDTVDRLTALVHEEL